MAVFNRLRQRNHIASPSRDAYLNTVQANITRMVHKHLAPMTMGDFPPFPPVVDLCPWRRHRIAVTGGAGFIGSHLVGRLLTMGHEVIVLDNMAGGSLSNLARWVGHRHLSVLNHDVTMPVTLEVDRIYHLACAASRNNQVECANDGSKT